MATYESFVTGASNFLYVYDGLWQSQTFTVGTTGTNENFTLNEIHGWFQRQGSPGTLTIELYAVDGSGHPTGSALSSGTINANTFDLYGAVEETITMSPAYELQASTEYAIVAHIVGGSTSQCVLWHYNGSGGYAGGNIEESMDSGASWFTYADIDLLFLVDGTAVSVTIIGQGDGVASLSGTLKGFAKCIASSDDISALSATMQGQGKLQAITDSIADAGGIIGGLGDLQASFTTYSELSGTLGVMVSEIVGQSDSVSALEGVLRGIGSISGQTDGIVNLSGSIIGQGSLSGESNGISSLSLVSTHEFELFEGDSTITTILNKTSAITLILTETSAI